MPPESFPPSDFPGASAPAPAPAPVAANAANAPVSGVPSAPGMSPAAAWGNVVLAALLMVATLPGRTQGLGLITEPMLADLKLDRITYAGLNLWATLLGAAACLPVGRLIDRRGLRWTAAGILLPLAAVVWLMSLLPAGGSVAVVFILILLTRALGQSALSVVSITAAGKTDGLRSGVAMAGFTVLLSVFFIIAFVVIGDSITARGWRAAWGQLAAGLAAVAALTVLLMREPGARRETETGGAPESGMTPREALRTPLFRVFAGATALFGLVSSGFGLFNESVLAERGFDRPTFHAFLGASTFFALVGQMLCGWLSLSRPLPRLLAAGMFLYAAGLGALPLLRTVWQLWIFAAVFGVAAGFVTVLFFSIWGQAFGRAHLGRIQGAAQMLTVLASAAGPLLFASVREACGSHAPLLYALTPVVLLSGLAAWRTRLPEPGLPEPPGAQDKSLRGK